MASKRRKVYSSDAPDSEASEGDLPLDVKTDVDDSYLWDTRADSSSGYICTNSEQELEYLMKKPGGVINISLLL
jgi:hypothetical protein